MSDKHLCRVTLLFRGFDATGNLNDTWTWGGNTWTQVVNTGPAPRRFASLAYDRGRSVAVFFGGAGESGVLSDTWEWDGVAWTQVASSGPSPRTPAGMACDSGLGVCVMQSGWDQSFGYYMDTWEWDGTAWALPANGYPGHDSTTSKRMAPQAWPWHPTCYPTLHRPATGLGMRQPFPGIRNMTAGFRRAMWPAKRSRSSPRRAGADPLRRER